MGKLHLRITAVLLTICMFAGMLPMHVFASETQEPTAAVTEPVTVTEIPVETEETTEGATEPPATDAATEPETTESEETVPEETETEENAVDGEQAELLLADADALAAALEEAKEFIDALTLNNTSNVPEEIVSTWKSEFTWDNEKRESNNKSYLFEWSYYNGVVFEGLDYVYDVTGEESYADYVQAYLAAMITESGSWATTSNNASKAAAGYNATHGADCYKTASLLLDYYKITGDSRYLAMAQTLYTDLKNAQSSYTSADRGYNYNHTWASAPSYAVWLDGLYMIQPFMAEYAAYTNDTEELSRIAGRFAWIGENMFNEETGLYYHMANSSTDYYNNSDQYWGRAIGWYAAAMVDVMDHLTGDDLAAMKTQFKRLVDGMLPYQTEDGMWRQFVNVESSAKETSVTALMTYAIMKAVNSGWLEESYAQYGTAAFAGMCSYALDDSGLHYICFKGSHTAYTAVSYDTYVNEGKGVGPFIMAYAQTAAYSIDEPADPDPSEPTEPTEPTEPEVGEAETVTVDGVTIRVSGVTELRGQSLSDADKALIGAKGYAAYIAADISTNVTGDSAVISIPVPAGWAASRVVGISVEDGAVVEIIGTYADGSYAFPVTHFSPKGIALLAAEDGTIGKYVSLGDGTKRYVYELVTSITSNSNYVIVGSGDPYALMNNDNKIGTQLVTISEKTLTSEVELDEWEFSGTQSATISNGDRYLLRSNNTLQINNTSTTWTITNNGNGQYRIYNSNRHLRYNNSTFNLQNTTSNQPTVRLYKYSHDETVGGGYAIAEGTSLYSVLTNTTEEGALAAVKAGVTVFSATDANGTGKAPVDDGSVTWKWVDNYDPNTVGSYTMEILYEGVSLGTVEVETGYQTEIKNEWTVVETIPSYRYVLDTDGYETGSGNRYLFVASDAAYAMDEDAAGVVPVTLNNNQTEAIMDSRAYEWYITTVTTGNWWNQQTYYPVTKDGNNWIYHENHSMHLGTNDNGYWTINQDDRAQGLYRFSNVDNYTWYLYYDSADHRMEVSTSNSNRVRLYKYAGEIPGSSVYAKIEGNTVYRMMLGATESEALDAVKAGITGYLADDANGLNAEQLADGDLTWEWLNDYNGQNEGTYWVQISYDGEVLGTVEVQVQEITATYTITATEGYVAQHASTKAQVRDVNGDPIYIIAEYSDGTIEKTYLTVGMLTDAQGAAVSTKTPGDFTDLTATYGDYTSGFTLHVVERLVNDYPEYPNEGSVNVNKTAQGIDFQSSGVAKVELSASGIPAKQGVDVVLVADISNSMAWKAGAKNTAPAAGETTKWQDLQASASQFAQILLDDYEDGTSTLNSLSFVIFGGYDKERNNNSGSYTNYFDATQTVFTYASTFEDAYDGIYMYDIQGTDSAGYTATKNGVSVGTPQGGTNYDYAFLEAADAIDQLKADYQENSGIPYDESNRKIYVIFMTDGAPDHYNQLYYKNRDSGKFDYYALYRNEHDGQNGFTNYLTEAPTVSGFNGSFRQRQTNGYYLPTADMNKDQWTSWILSDSLSAAERVAEIDGVESITSIGFDLANGAFGGFAFTETELTTVLSNLAGEDSCEVMVTDDAAELTSFYEALANSIKEAATNARFEDQVMGSAFDLQTTTVEYTTLENGSQVTKTIIPVIEVKDYAIYTLQDVDQKLCTEDMIGERKDNGTIREAVCFSDDGTKVYSSLIDVDKDGTFGVTVNSDGTYTISDTDDNILDTDGVIYAKSFMYNTETSAVTVNVDKDGDGVKEDHELTPESFYWNMGTISTTEMALSYYVYLSGARDQQKPAAGSYATNEQAILYYDNYLGNPCHKDTTSPVLAWQSANISFAFYLVDKNGDIVVNQSTGRTGSFANKIAVTAPVVYQELMLDNLGVINSIDVASLDVFPEGYSLYDEKASYTITINSDASGDWTITKSDGLVNSTYVTQYDPDNAAAYSNALTSDSADHDYTHTIVWFAVLYEVKTVPDTVVIDYGLPVDINVLYNDMFGDHGKLVGISAAGNIPKVDGENVIYSTELDAQVFPAEYTANYGKASIVETTNGGTELRYQLNTANGMQMAQAEKLAYAVDYDGTTGANGYYYGTVTIIPATTIYYEESFVTFQNSSAASDKGVWTAEGTVDKDAVQSEDRPGFNNLGSIDANNIYGFDPAYNKFTTYSLGGAKKITVDAATGGSPGTAGYAQFTFTGTGFDVISLTDSDSGTIIVQVFQGDTRIKNLIVDNYYGYKASLKNITYTYDGEEWTRVVGEDAAQNAVQQLPAFPDDPAEGTKVEAVEYVWVVTPGADTIWQVPVMKVDGLTYGTYTVKILPLYSKNYDHAGDGSYSFWMDAVRIYDPGLADDDANKAHGDDKELAPTFITLRDLLVDAGSLGSFENQEGNTVEGVVFIDGKTGTSSIDDYANPGPNNELYLAKGQGVSFRIQTYVKPEKVHLGVKLAFGSGASLRIGDTEFKNVTTATDMFYDITNRLIWTSGLDADNQMVYQSNVIVLSNNSANGVLSLTELKLTSGHYSISPMVLTGEDTDGVSLFVDREVLTQAPALMKQLYYMAPEPEEPETPTEPEPTDPEPTEPEVTPAVPGDMDGDGQVTVDDVLALLWYVLFPDDYPIGAEADFDGNGETNVDDVLTLLWYVLFPDDYPLTAGI